jgi:hypothetical protein
VTRTRVLLACEPPLLQDVLAAILEELPDVELVNPNSPTADVVVVSAPALSPGWSGVLPPAASTARCVIAVDAIRNVLQVREQRHGGVTEQQIDGHMARMIGLLQESSSEPDPHVADIA